MKAISTYTGLILPDSPLKRFVFGSNTQGRHGRGAAKYASDHFGAMYGIAEGPQGNAYAIVTKDLTKTHHPSVTKYKIKRSIYEFYIYAAKYGTLEFHVAYKGSGVNLNSYTPDEVAQMFAIKHPPVNVFFLRNHLLSC